MTKELTRLINVDKTDENKNNKRDLLPKRNKQKNDQGKANTTIHTHCQRWKKLKRGKLKWIPLKQEQLTEYEKTADSGGNKHGVITEG